MVGLTRDRARTWQLLADITARPTMALVERLDGNCFLDELASTVAWLDPDWRPNGLLVLRVFGRQVARRGASSTLETMGDAWVAATPLSAELHRAVTRLAHPCAAELAAWRQNDEGTAKLLRIEQMAQLGPDAPVRRVADDLAARRLPVYSHVAQVILGYVRLETGR